MSTTWITNPALPTATQLITENYIPVRLSKLHWNRILSCLKQVQSVDIASSRLFILHNTVVSTTRFCISNLSQLTYKNITSNKLIMFKHHKLEQKCILQLVPEINVFVMR